MSTTSECPFCGELLGVNDFLPGIGALCPRCRQRVRLTDLEKPLTASSTGSTAAAATPQAQPDEDELSSTDDGEPEEEQESVFRPARPRQPRRTIDVLPVLALLLGCLAILFPSVVPLRTLYQFGWVGK